jgi:hypothetical protein
VESCKRCGLCCKELYGDDLQIYQNLTPEQVKLVRRPRGKGCPMLHGVLCEIEIRFGKAGKCDVCKDYPLNKDCLRIKMERVK